MALRPGHAVGDAGIRSHEPADADGVVPYWTDWMERWPDARALAEAPRRGDRHRGGSAIHAAHCGYRNAPAWWLKITPTSCRARMTNSLHCPASAITHHGDELAFGRLNCRDRYQHSPRAEPCSRASESRGATSPAERAGEPHAAQRRDSPGAMLTSPIMPVAPNMS